MKITVKLRASLKRFSPSPDGILILELEDGAETDSIIKKLQIPDNDIGFVSVNKKISETSVLLSDGDEVEVFTMMKGG